MRFPIAIAVAIAAFTATPALAYQLKHDSQGGIAHWSRPLELVLDEGTAQVLAEPGTEAAVRAAVETVRAGSPGLTVSVRRGEALALGFAASGPNQNDIVAMKQWPFENHPLAVTVLTINANTHEVLDADVVLNAQDRRFRALDKSGHSTHPGDSGLFDDLQATLTHELGHAVGLDHNPDDATVVMYPYSTPNDISKRVLTPDDEAGLVALYPVKAPVEPPVGCSASGSPGARWALLPVLLGLALLRRRSRAPLALAAAVAFPALALAEPPAAEPEAAMMTQVASTRSFRRPQQPGLIVTELELRVTTCVRGPCPQRVLVVVPGGRIGDVEQIIADAPVPAQGQALAVLRTAAGRTRLWPVPAASPAPARTP